VCCNVATRCNVQPRVATNRVLRRTTSVSQPCQCTTACCNEQPPLGVVCCDVLHCLLQRVATCWGVSQHAAVCYSVLQYVAMCCSVLRSVAACCSMLHLESFCFRKCVLKTAPCSESLSSVPALLPTISFFLISIRMTILGRNVFPPPCPPASPTQSTHACIVMSRSKITFESQEVKPPIQRLPKSVITATYLLSSPPSFQPNLPLSPLFSLLITAI